MRQRGVEKKRAFQKSTKRTVQIVIVQTAIHLARAGDLKRHLHSTACVSTSGSLQCTQFNTAFIH